jgi:hypothetical protein
VKIRNAIRTLLIGCALIALSGAPLFGAGRIELYEDMERAALLVTRITAPNTEGAGILIHVDAQHVYGITAKHVLFQQGKIVQGLKVELRNWPGRQLPVVGYRLHHEEDLAVFWAEHAPLGLSLPEILQGIPLDLLGASTELDPGAALFSLGHSTAGAWISPKEPVRFARGDGNLAFFFEHSCPQGHSGGAVFDDQWRLVGMMIDEERPFCRALRIDPVLKIVQGWKLEISLRPPPPRKGDKAASEQITVAVVDFDNRSAKNLPNLGFVAQDITTSYLHTLPGIVLVSRDRLDSIRDEIKLLGTVNTGEGISRVGHLLQADALVTGSIVRYDVERRTFEGYNTSALQDVFRMTISLQVLEVETARVKFSKNFNVERVKQYPKAASAPGDPIDLTSELLTALLDQAQPELRSAISQILTGGGQFIDVPVSSTPAGADVILNGIYMGKTPITLQVAREIHEVRVILPGYEPWVRRFRAEVGKGIEATLVQSAH